MKRFIYKLLPFVLVCVGIFIVFPMVVDPYNVFHYRNIRDNGVEPNKNYIKMRYILGNPAKFNAFLFGSSRVSLIDFTNINDKNKWYNMTYSEGLPAEHLENLEMMLKNNIVPDTVLLGLDNISFLVNPEIHKNQLIRSPYPVPLINILFFKAFANIKFLVKYCNYKMVLSSLDTITAYKNNNEQKPTEYFYENGGMPEDNILSKDWDDTIAYWEDHYKNRTEECLSEIARISELCKKNNVKLIVFTNPIHISIYQKSVENGYLDFLYKLAEITGYYNFSGINDITIDKHNYYDSSHYSHTVGNMITNTIFNNINIENLSSQGFGYYVTMDNRDEFMMLLKKQENFLLGDI
jgi:hypothetical protein